MKADGLVAPSGCISNPESPENKGGNTVTPFFGITRIYVFFVRACVRVYVYAYTHVRILIISIYIGVTGVTNIYKRAESTENKGFLA